MASGTVVDLSPWVTASNLTALRIQNNGVAQSLQLDSDLAYQDKQFPWNATPGYLFAVWSLPDSAFEESEIWLGDSDNGQVFITWRLVQFQKEYCLAYLPMPKLRIHY